MRLEPAPHPTKVRRITTEVRHDLKLSRIGDSFHLALFHCPVPSCHLRIPTHFAIVENNFLIHFSLSVAGLSI